MRKDFTFWLIIICLLCIALSAGYFLAHIFKDIEPVEIRLDIVIGLLVIIAFEALMRLIPKK